MNSESDLDLDDMSAGLPKYRHHAGFFEKRPCHNYPVSCCSIFENVNLNGGIYVNPSQPSNSRRAVRSHV